MTTAFQAITPCREPAAASPSPMPSVGPLPAPPNPARGPVSFVSFCHCLESQSVIFSTVSSSWLFNVSTRGSRCFDKEPFLGIRHSTVARTQSSPEGTRHNQPFATKHTNMVSPSTMRGSCETPSSATYELPSAGAGAGAGYIVLWYY